MTSSTMSRIDRVLAAHPHLDEEEVRSILIHYYHNEWSYPGATSDDVDETLELITESLIAGKPEEVQRFVNVVIAQR